MKLKTVSEIELAYCAGIWDGEGCFCIGYSPVKLRRKSEYWFLVASICMTDPQPLRKLSKLFGGNLHCYARKGVHKSVWEWKLWSRRAANFALALLPYLTVKKKQARLAIKFQSYITSKCCHGGKGNALTLVDKVKRIQFHQKMKTLNHRGKLEV